ncbi:MAG: sigma-70 family RNA polymerase sigma factor, partial [Myxococcales bacterium]|nr:sigma-70 family RNA polymerase sigma factor [Myxococcales bacterium]
DLVQETFRKALEHPPPDTERSIRPWLFRVATNLGIDALRRRQRERYLGPWLPEPIDTERVVADLEPGPDARYDLVESATSAFLLALEALDPRQRAVLLLRDVMGLTGPETADALGTTAGNVRVILHRARERLEAYDRTRQPITPELRDRTARALRELMLRMGVGDFEGVARLLADDATSIHDGGGEFVAVVRVLRGPQDILRTYSEIVRFHDTWPLWVEERELNGLPALLVRYPDLGGRYARNVVFWVELSPTGQVAGLRGVVASAKLGSLRFRER